MKSATGSVSTTHSRVDALSLVTQSLTHPLRDLPPAAAPSAATLAQVAALIPSVSQAIRCDKFLLIDLFPDNYMDYSYDACMTEFTPGQATRLKSQMRTYRDVTI